MIPEAMAEEHEELHAELRKAIKIPGSVGKAARQAAEVLHPHFERENELALPVIGITKELAEANSPQMPTRQLNSRTSSNSNTRRCFKST